MEMKTHSADGVMHLAMQGEFTIYDAGIKDELLALCAGPRVEIDLSQVNEIDSVGVQLLLLVLRQAQMQQRSLRLVALHPAVNTMFELYDLHQTFGLDNNGELPS